jgi:RNA polymerase II subunit A small phosphatase-like protein
MSEKTAVNSSPIDNPGSSSTTPAINLGRAPSNREKAQPPIPGQPGSLDTNVPTTAGAPQIELQAPTPVSPDEVSPEEEQLIHDRTPEQEQRDTDIEMTDSGPNLPISPNDVQQGESGEPLHKDASQVTVDLPPPPPIQERTDQIQHPQEVGKVEPQKWLLPAVRPEHQGRKCLVLDLDETLVHSSFKVRISW